MMIMIIKENRFGSDEGSFFGVFVSGIVFRDGNINFEKAKKVDLGTKKAKTLVSIRSSVMGRGIAWNELWGLGRV